MPFQYFRNLRLEALATERPAAILGHAQGIDEFLRERRFERRAVEKFRNPVKTRPSMAKPPHAALFSGFARSIRLRSLGECIAAHSSLRR